MPLTRRSVLTGLAALGGAGLGSAAMDVSLYAPAAAADLSADEAIPPFKGGRQAGIATPRPASVALASFDSTARDVRALAGMLKAWTKAIRNLTAGLPADSRDSGECRGLGPQRLTITVGFGSGLFDDRFGLAALRPSSLTDVPPMPGDHLSARHSNGDIVVQACSESEVIASHAIRQLARIGANAARLRWQSAGSAPSAAKLAGRTARNPLGFLDGTGNPQVGSPAFGSAVWVHDPSTPAWLHGGSFLCFRKIRIDTVAWDRLTVAEQQIVIGRHKRSGAPLTVRTGSGGLALPHDSHVRLASPSANNGATFFRRSFAYDDGVEHAEGQLDTGFLFLAFAADPSRQFIPVLRKLAPKDRLGAFTTHVASGVWAIPPAPAGNGWIGQQLLS